MDSIIIIIIIIIIKNEFKFSSVRDNKSYTLFVNILFLKLLIFKDSVTKTDQNEMHYTNFSTGYKHKL